MWPCWKGCVTGVRCHITSSFEVLFPFFYLFLSLHLSLSFSLSYLWTNASSQLLFWIHACLSAAMFLTMMIMGSNPLEPGAPKLNTLFYKCPWSWRLLTAIEQSLRQSQTRCKWPFKDRTQVETGALSKSPSSNWLRQVSFFIHWLEFSCGQDST